MAKQKYVFNDSTLKYEKVELSAKARILKGLGFLSIVLLCSFGLYTVAYTIIPTPKELAMHRDMEKMEYQFSTLSTDFERISGQLDNLQEKDAEVHRMIFGIDPIDESIWDGGTGGDESSDYFTAYSNSEEIINATQERVDNINYKMEIQKSSLDTIYALARQREAKLTSIPSIKPVQEDKLKRKMRHMSGFGIRIHPVHKVNKFHKGIDFTAPKGTAIQATGNGKVTRVQKRKIGYGNNVTIDHGFGYTTLYAHMATVSVKEGQQVMKGEQIGTIGSTGTSTAPHLHYEVRINDRPVNPIDYCLDGLTPEEYKELVLKAKVQNQSFD